MVWNELAVPHRLAGGGRLQGSCFSLKGHYSALTKSGDRLGMKWVNSIHITFSHFYPLDVSPQGVATAAASRSFNDHW
jgi:hypothetical protein